MTTKTTKAAAKPAPKPKPRKLGALKGKIYIAPDAFTPAEMRPYVKAQEQEKATKKKK